MTVKYRVFLLESERGWGQERWTEDYDTFQEAQNRVVEVNSKNTAKYAPDWYMAADPNIQAVEV